MALTVADATAKLSAITGAFDTIGLAGETKMPRSRRSNTEAIAWEFYVAGALTKAAEARLKKAKAQAVKAGLMFDPEKEQRPVGTNEVLFAGDVVEIAVSVTTPSSRFDDDAFVDGLIEKGVSRRIIDPLRERCTKANRAPHRFTAVIATSK